MKGIRELGYPSPTALRNWYKEYTATGELHSASASKPHYTEQEKVAAVDYFETNKTSLSQTCRALGYPCRYVLRKWIPERKPILLNKKETSCTHEQKVVKYSQEQKLVAVQTLLVDKIPDYKVAAKYRVCRATLYNWKQQLLRKDEVVSVVQKPTAVAEGIKRISPAFRHRHWSCFMRIQKKWKKNTPEILGENLYFRMCPASRQCVHRKDTHELFLMA